MAENKKSFILYCDLIHTVEKMPDDKAGKLMKHLLRYVNDMNPECDDMVVDVVFEGIKQQLKRDLKHWEEIRLVKSETGRIGGLKSGESRRKKQTKQPLQKGSKSNQDEANEAVTVNVTDTVIKISFSEFWDLYDKKVGNRAACEKKWKKLKTEEQQQIIKMLPTYKIKTPDIQFRPFPETFLNQRRWENEDEINTPVNKQPTQFERDSACYS